MAAGICGEDSRITTLCIDSYEQAVPVGRFYNSGAPDGKVFRSTTQLLLELERSLDEMDFPKSFNAVRTFAPPSEQETGPPDHPIRSGERATFAVRILFRRNSSWQGSLTWLDGRQEQSFRSVLELILLLDSALSYEKAS